MSSPFDPVTFRHDPAMANRLMLAPLTNTQSHADGRLSDEELPWLQTERFGIRTAHIVEVYQRIVGSGQVDLIDMSLWDVDRRLDTEGFEGRSLTEIFAGLPRGDVRLGVAGKIHDPADVQRVLEAGVDIAVLGRVVHHAPRLPAVAGEE
ncbi:MAG: hypothetical protein LH616_06215 [Ilumatobacteraceae bacterium]|nr:hypothetical protein [Ilumatobacteraceae bacterium]